MPFRRVELLQLLGSSALFVLVAGCASPGQPKPPSLNVPQPATNLHAQRVGSQVHLTWSSPADSTDGQALRGPVTAVVCRDSHPSPECHRVAAFPDRAGASQFDDPLPPPLLTGAPALLLYRIQLVNSFGRAAGLSAPAWSASGQAPAPMGPITVTPARGGAVIAWKPSNDPSPVELRRTLLTAPTRSSAARIGTTPGQDPADRTPARALPGSYRPLDEVTTLRVANAGDAASGDSGGLVDPGVQPLATYSYLAQRVRTVTLPEPSAPGGSVTIELRGQPSPPAAVLFRDTFPPRPPLGLVAISTPGGSPDPTADPPSIDLSWEPGREPDLQGYYVYRADLLQGPYHRLNAAPLPGPAYRDLDVHPGQTLFYRVTTVDRAGNESAPTPPLSQAAAAP